LRRYLKLKRTPFLTSASCRLHEKGELGIMIAMPSRTLAMIGLAVSTGVGALGAQQQQPPAPVPPEQNVVGGLARAFQTPYGVEFVELQELGRIYIFDIGGPHTFKTIYMDGRSHPKNPQLGAGYRAV
jgi:hypothetical protein